MVKLIITDMLLKKTIGVPAGGTWTSFNQL